MRVFTYEKLCNLKCDMESYMEHNAKLGKCLLILNLVKNEDLQDLVNVKFYHHSVFSLVCEHLQYYSSINIVHNPFAISLQLMSSNKLYKTMHQNLN